MTDDSQLLQGEGSGWGSTIGRESFNDVESAQCGTAGGLVVGGPTRCVIQLQNPTCLRSRSKSFEASIGTNSRFGVAPKLGVRVGLAFSLLGLHFALGDAVTGIGTHWRFESSMRDRRTLPGIDVTSQPQSGELSVVLEGCAGWPMRSKSLPLVGAGIATRSRMVGTSSSLCETSDDNPANLVPQLPLPDASPRCALKLHFPFRKTAEPTSAKAGKKSPSPSPLFLFKSKRA
ncbi:hypothetical protein V8F20_004875 [Naviculisporaceae sp. PSN 640]